MMYHAAFWPFFLFIPLFWIAVIVVLAIVFGRRRRAWWGYHYGAQTSSAEQTLAQRYANGDIDEQEYRARLEVLRANRPGPRA
ncbi:SHOCT domain-containing protein [Gryllotalpicola ginsengisoli]|uniref:SHOCT domain-containing protein n=1 Tax=Gryllotalpicola ginsengisoli TaxID=444608 RepID=UPI0003B39D1C|nr:SHOCT domain-containing protein [Gryllotalpicola ginsengisoli]